MPCDVQLTRKGVCRLSQEDLLDRDRQHLYAALNRTSVIAAQASNSLTELDSRHERLVKMQEGLPKGFAEDPADTFRRHVSISCTPTMLSDPDDLPRLREAIGVESIVMGSDYPHAEGLEDPKDMVRELDGFSEDEIRLVMRENGLGLVQPPTF